MTAFDSIFVPYEVDHINAERNLMAKIQHPFAVNMSRSRSARFQIVPLIRSETVTANSGTKCDAMQLTQFCLHVVVQPRVLFRGLTCPWISLAHRVGSFKDDRYVFIVMEVVSGGEMFTHLRRARKFSDEQSARVMLRSVNRAIEWVSE